MFTTPAPSAPTLSTSTSQASPSSPTRPSRLRGLSYLRNYTHNHIHSHSGAARPVPGRTRSHPSARDDSPSENHEDTTALAHDGAMTTSRRGGSRSTTRQPGDGAAVANNTGSRISRGRADSTGASTTLPSTGSSTNLNVDASARPDKSEEAKKLPSIRFIPHLDPRAPRPSLSFAAISRTLPNDSSIIRIGRFSERDTLPDIPQNVPSAAPVGFKSKVVSRRHCEFWFQDGRWYIKDVKSSSGTFLNHIRLSQPGLESKPFEVKDGDVVQLGIDFRGGAEMIFRCVKIRIECNRGWQQGLNNFNKQTHKRLRNLAKTKPTKTDGDAASTHSSECAICLMSIAPCQSLFVAPCSHVWHYKCIRPILQAPTAPTFLCPNCRAVTDLEADVDEPNGFSESDDSEVEAAAMQDAQKAISNALPDTGNTEAAPRVNTPGTLSGAPAVTANPAGSTLITQRRNNDSVDGARLDDMMAGLSFSDAHHVSDDTDSPVEIPPPNSSTTQPLPISINAPNSLARNLSPDGSIADSDFPMTPRNDIGPFVLDGSAGRSTSGSRRGIEPQEDAAKIS